jgi:hypothetical protein
MISRPAIAITAAVLCASALATIRSVAAGSEVYIQQSRGQVSRDSGPVTAKPQAEITSQPSQPAVAPPTAPDTCNAQNAASSQACYAATQQARPASR